MTYIKLWLAKKILKTIVHSNVTLNIKPNYKHQQVGSNQQGHSWDLSDVLS